MLLVIGNGNKHATEPENFTSLSRYDFYFLLYENNFSISLFIRYVLLSSRLCICNIFQVSDTNVIKRSALFTPAFVRNSINVSYQVFHMHVCTAYI